ncbi:hypothetical protein P691DRAFT_184036 [Macrolepiota fuliginosa MF-IS2]|uniref:Uncharacterized protein n=1 Tax=Macrolepiota fuliginosa MF-IS2 TaxID=1400762 RepID=A0A9P5XA14_9AGAR|nr:hypothetical protein P691DRAFT_184036 [Macrolepiota fuliginosa MF-IS2]
MSLPGLLEIPGRRSIERQHDMSESESSLGRVSPSDTPSASESEDSLEFIDAARQPELSAREREDQRGRQGIEFPCGSPSLGSSTYVNTSVSPSSESGLPRGRAKTKLKSTLDLTEEDIIPEPEPEPSPVRSTKKRFLSLSPLRTLFPPKQHQALQARALSAHPPGTSPYATPRSTHFFRSTTSLASSSMLRLPFAASTLTLTANKPESVKVSKKFFQSGKEKEKEREYDECSAESLESWEILETEDSRRTVFEYEPRSLMAMIAPVPDSPSSVLSPELSPTRSLSFTYGAPPTPTALSPLSPIVSQPASVSTQTQSTTQSWNEPHPLSLRDRKVAEAIEPFLKRRPRKDGTHHRSRTAPSPIVVPPVSLGTGPLVTTVRTRMNPANNHQDNQMAMRAAAERREPITASERGDGIGRIDENIHELQRALETPLPSSPIQSLLSSSPSSVTIHLASPTTPKGGMMLEDNVEESGVQPSPGPTPKVAMMLDTPIVRPAPIGRVCEQHSPTEKVLASKPKQNHSTTPPRPPPSHYHQHSESAMFSSPSQVGRRHYRGRPLPRPPQVQPPRNVVVDSIYAGHEAFPSQTSGSPNTTCPEGLLIDFEDGADANVSGSWTPPWDEHSHQLHPSSAPMTPNRISPIGSPSPTPDSSIRSLPLSLGNVSSISGLSEMTDLDLLAAALGEGNNGEDYEVCIDFDLGSPPPNLLMDTLVRHWYLFQTF